MVKQIKRGGGRMKTAYWSLVSMASAMLISLQPVMADTIWNRPAGWNQHDCGGYSGGHRIDCQDDFQKPARSR